MSQPLQGSEYSDFLPNGEKDYSEIKKPMQTDNINHAQRIINRIIWGNPEGTLTIK